MLTWMEGNSLGFFPLSVYLKVVNTSFNQIGGHFKCGSSG